MNSLHVIFGTGPLALSVMRALRTRENISIRMINRSGNRHDIPADVEVVSADAYDETQVVKATQGADVVYQCAQPAYTEWAEKFPPLQTSILNGVAKNGAKLIVGDNLYMYGETQGAPIHEELPYKAHGSKGKTRAKMAQELFEAHRAGKIRMAIARGSNFYGEGVKDSTIGERVFDFMIDGKPASVFGNIDLPHTVTYIGDFGEAMVMLGENDKALGQAWHVPNANPSITTREMIEKIATEMGIEAKISVMPKFLFETISLFHPMLREFREMRYEFEEAYVVDSQKFVTTFGDISTPMEEAINNTITWYKNHNKETA